MPVTTFSLPAPVGFNFHSTIWSHGWYQLPPFAYDEAQSLLERIHQLNDGRVLHLKLSPNADHSAVQVTVEGLSGTLDAQTETEIALAVSRILSLDQDLQHFYEWLRDKPQYAWVRQRGAGRMMACPTVWEDLAKTLLTTNTTWNMTKQMCARLCSLGTPYSYSDGRTAFPTPQRIAAMSPDELSEKVRAGYRNAYLHELATAIASGLDVETWHANGDGAALYKHVRGLKGFGDYAAGSIVRLLGRHDRLSIDSVAREAYQALTRSDSKPTDAEIRAYYDQYGEWRGLVQWMDIMARWLDEGVS